MHTVRVHTGADDDAYSCMGWGPDREGVNGVWLRKDVPLQVQYSTGASAAQLAAAPNYCALLSEICWAGMDAFSLTYACTPVPFSGPGSPCACSLLYVATD
jgi:hypothetical protein